MLNATRLLTKLTYTTHHHHLRLQPRNADCSLLGIAVGPILWNPLSQTIGRRYTYLIGSLLYLPCIVWCAESKSYVSFAVARVFAGLCSAFSQTVPPA